MPTADVIAKAKAKRLQLRQAHLAPDYVPSEGRSLRGLKGIRKKEDALGGGSEGSGSEGDDGDGDDDGLRVKFSAGGAPQPCLRACPHLLPCLCGAWPSTCHLASEGVCWRVHAACACIACSEDLGRCLCRQTRCHCCCRATQPPRGSSSSGGRSRVGRGRRRLRQRWRLCRCAGAPVARQAQQGTQVSSVLFVAQNWLTDRCAQR